MTIEVEAINQQENTMQFQINIGLDVPNKAVNHTAQQAKALALLQETFSHVQWRVAHSATEPTLVASFTAAQSRVYAEALRISEALEQDCVAVFNTQRQVGALVGPKAAEWGLFNKAYFIAL